MTASPAVPERLSAALADRYRIERALGAGGMATVYLAEDLKHHRNVAIKVLKPELAAVLGAERFVQEITTTAALNHPHILPLFDSGTADGFLYYVMPYIEGETIRERLNRETQLGVDDAVRITTEVADALDYAHRHGVIHRDIKPENILLHDGRPMVMDFGIALAVSAAAGGRMTETGLSLGTPHYMSPEQATADKQITARSDIYSLASVLYEMLAGEPPHTGGSAQAIIMKIIAERVRAVTELRRSVPPEVADALAQALEKVPADRFASAAEFAAALGGRAAAGTRSVRSRTVAERGSNRRSQVALAIGAVLLGVIATKVVDWGVAEEPSVRASHFILDLPDSIPLAPLRAGLGRIALSADGSKLAFVSERAGSSAIYLRELGDPVSRLIPGTEGGWWPAFSPNGEWLVFSVALQRRLKKVPIGGGVPRELGDAIGAAVWRPDGTILVSSISGLFSVPEDGGSVTTLVARGASSLTAPFTQPAPLPGGEYVLGVVSDPSEPSLGILRLADGTITSLGVAGVSPKFDGQGHILFARTDGGLYAVPFSPRKREVTGPPVAILQGLQRNAAGNRVDLAVAEDGTVAFVSGSSLLRQLVRVDRSGKVSALGNDERFFGWPRVSPDGKRIALEIGERGTARFDIWVYDIGPRTLSRLTSGGSGFRTVGWTRDGRRVVFVAPDVAGPSAGARLTMIQSLPWDNSGALDTLARVTERRLWEATIGPAEMVVRTVEQGANVSGDFLFAPLSSPDSLRPFLVSPANELTPRLSPDGRFVAYASDETGAPEVYVRPVPGPGSRLKVSNGGGLSPVWSRSGRELFYRTGVRMMSATLTLGTELSVVRRDSLFDDRFYNDASPQYDVFPDGGLLMIRDVPGVQARLGVIVNWRGLLEKNRE